MKIFHSIVQSALLVTTSMVYPTNEFPRFAIQEVNHQSIQIPDLRTLSYDEVLDLLSKIESDSFDERYSMEELDQINEFVSLLAMEGVTDDEKLEMECAVASLYRSDSIYYALLPNSGFGCSARPAIYVEGAQDFVLCKSWFKKQWDQTRSFVKKHKKAIIIGAIVVVTVAVVVVTAVVISSSAASAAAAASGALASTDDSSNTPTRPSHSKSDGNSYSAPKDSQQGESLASSIQSQVSTFKETIAQEQFAAAQESNGISIEENGRIIGSLFASKVVDSLANSFAQNPTISTELKDFGFNSQYPIPGWLQIYSDSSTIMPHSSIDLAFSTDYTTSYGRDFGDLNSFVYQVRGDLALNSQCYAQAVQDFGKAISLDPSNSTLYLERGIANFELGNYEQSIADYNQFLEKKAEPFSVTDFSLGFAKGAPKGAYESGKGALLFLSDFVAHPIQTSKQVVDSISRLATLVKNDELGVVAEALSPELHQLITQWDTLPSEIRGELAGYAVGKLGTDLLAPGAVAKVASKSVNSAKELVAVCKNLQIAQETLVLETAAGMQNTVKIAEVVRNGQTMIALGEDVGFSVSEIAQLKQAGKLEGAINSGLEKLVSQSESEVLKAAINQNKHVKMVKDYLDKPIKEVQKGINSYEKQIALHKDKIVNPTKYCPDWDKLDPRQREALVNKKWPVEIKVYEEQKNVLQSILNERLSYE